MDAWAMKVGFLVALGLGFAVYLWRKSRRRTHQTPRLDGPLADLRAWQPPRATDPLMVPWYGWRKELRLLLRQEDGITGLVVIALVLALAGYGLWNLFR
jgi:hypothetical protein